jgi:hypothetical protein
MSFHVLGLGWMMIWQLLQLQAKAKLWQSAETF